jgi:recombinational DNA repair ATPase RecF
MANNLRITGIDIHNFERIKVVSLKIDPEKGLVTIGGENAQGKTSALDSIEAALGIVRDKVKKPCRDGEPNAKIRLTVPPYEFIRYWDDGKGKDEGKKVPVLKVFMKMENGEKTSIGSPSAFLKSIIGGAFTDPVEFLTMQPKDQRATLIELTGLNLDEIDAKIKQAWDEYQRLTKVQQVLEAKFQEQPHHPDAPKEQLSMTNLSDNLQDAMTRNQWNDQERTAARQLYNDAQTAEQRAKIAADAVKELEQKLIEAKKLSEAADEEASNLTKMAESRMSKANQLKDEDLTPFREALNSAERTNIMVRENAAKEAARVEWSKAEAESGRQWEAYQGLNLDKKHILSEASFPVPNLGFDSEQVTLNGNPFSQASSAERIRAAVAISLARAGQLPLILIKDASVLDAKSLQVLADEAEARGAQVFAEIVANRDDDGNYDKECSLYIYDGMLDSKESKDYDLDAQPTLEGVGA